MGVTKKGVWDLQEVRDKQLASEWAYDSDPDPGKIFVVGNNDNGQLGQNNTINYSSPVQIPGTTWGAGTRYAETNQVFALKEGGLYAWGKNSNHGQLGLNDTVSRSSPTQVGSATNWAAVTSGTTSFSTSMAANSDGELFAWGSGYAGTLGNNINGTSTPNWRFSSPVQIPGTDWSREINLFGNNAVALKTNGTLWLWGGNNSRIFNDTSNGRSSPTQIGTDTTWNKMSRGGNAGEIYGIKTDGTLWAWGANNKGQLGLNQGFPALIAASSPTQVGTDTNWANLGIGEASVVATKTNGTLWTWGDNNYGQLGLNSINDPRSSPTQIGTDTDWHKSEFVPQQYGAMIMKTNGEVYGWGRNNRGQLGQNQGPGGNTDARSSPVQIPGTYRSVNAAGDKAFSLGRPA